MGRMYETPKTRMEIFDFVVLRHKFIIYYINNYWNGRTQVQTQPTAHSSDLGLPCCLHIGCNDISAVTHNYATGAAGAPP